MEYLLKTKIFIIVLILTHSKADGGVGDNTDDVVRRYQKFNWRLPTEFQQPEIFLEDLPENFYDQHKNWPHEKEPIPAPDAYDDEYDSEKELEGSLPYGIQNVRDVFQTKIRALRTKPIRETRITFQSLCPSRRETVFLNLQTEFEYRPNHYDEVSCIHPYTNHKEYVPQINKVDDGVCGQAGFNCIQLNRTIFLTRKSARSDCWESETRLIPAGCECMWPKHHFGDIGGHH